jgi:hypothetical protein
VHLRTPDTHTHRLFKRTFFIFWCLGMTVPVSGCTGPKKKERKNKTK